MEKYRKKSRLLIQKIDSRGIQIKIGIKEILRRTTRWNNGNPALVKYLCCAGKKKGAGGEKVRREKKELNNYRSARRVTEVSLKYFIHKIFSFLLLLTG